MTTIDARFVKKARNPFWCDGCNRLIKSGTPYIRMYGMAESHETPWTIRFHFECINSPHIKDQELKKALEAAERHIHGTKASPI